MSSTSESFSYAVRRHQAGDLDAAVAIYEEILARDPSHAGARHLLGVIAHQRGRHEEAIGLISRAIELEPIKATFRNNLGAALMRLGRFSEAAASLEEAIRIKPDYADALSNLGATEHCLGRHEGARRSLQRALAVNPWHADALFNLGNLLAELGERSDAASLYRRAIEVAPGRADLRINLGNALLDLQLDDEAVAEYQAALALDPESALALSNLGTALEKSARSAEAEAFYEARARRTPAEPAWRIRAASCCPAVFGRPGEAEEVRERLERVLDEHQGLGLDWRDDFAATGCTPSFALAHLGGDGRRIREKFAGLYRSPSPRPTLGQRSGPPRIGFVVTNPNEAVFLRCAGGLLRNLTAGRFEVTVFGSLRGVEQLRRGVARPDFRYVAFPADRVNEAADRIRAERCDLLYYWEVGMDTLNYLLPFARPAPAQCTSWGIQVTTGHPAIDCYLSSDLVEAPEADAHYSEALIRLPTLLAHQERIPAAAYAARRSDLGLPRDATIYGCLQRPRKLQPGFDDLIAGILRSDPCGLVVLLGGYSRRVGEALRARLAAGMPDVHERVIVLPSADVRTYRGFLSVVDVALDPRPYGMGSSAYDVFSFDIPVVTWPTPHNAGRYVAACCDAMGVSDLVADSARAYIDTASRLGLDAEYRVHVRKRIAEASGTLFADNAVVRGHEDAFEDMIARYGAADPNQLPENLR